MLLPLVDSTSFSGLESIPKNYAQIGYISKRNKRSKDFFPKNSREFPKNQSRSSGIPKSRKFSIPKFGNPEIPKIPIPKFREFLNPENFPTLVCMYIFSFFLIFLYFFFRFDNQSLTGNPAIIDTEQTKQ